MIALTPNGFLQDASADEGTYVPETGASQSSSKTATVFVVLDPTQTPVPPVPAWGGTVMEGKA
jgi:hypothetical protein